MAGTLAVVLWWYAATMEQETRQTIRLPDPLLARLRRAADHDRRSVHAQMLTYIERGLDQDESMTQASQASRKGSR